MKKILCLLLALCLIFLVCSCGKKESDTNPFDIEKIVDMNKVRKLENINSFNDLNDDEETYYTNLMVEAIKALDVDTLAKLFPYDTISINFLKTIKNNDEKTQLWDMTIGQYIYLPQSRQLVYRSPMHIYCMWMEMAYSNNGFVANEITRYNYARVIEVYNKYYNNAFYTSKKLSISEVNTIHALFYETLGIAGLDLLADGALFQFVLPEIENGFESQSNINNKEFFPDWQHFKDLKIDSMAPLVEETLDFYYEFKDEYNYYFKNQENKDKMQRFLDEKCKPYRTAINITYFVPVKKDSLMLTKTESDFIKDINLYEYGVFINGVSYQYMLKPMITSAVQHNIIPVFSKQS